VSKIVQLCFVVLTWGAVMLSSPEIVVKVFGIYLVPIVGIIFGLLSTFLPKIFGMGVQGFKKANVLERCLPLLVVSIIAALIQATNLQTYATAYLLSWLTGSSVAYLGFITSELLPKKKEK